MDILVAHKNLQLLQERIDVRVAKVDRGLIEGLYVLQGRYLEHLPTCELLQRYMGIVQNLAYLLDAERDKPPVHCGFISSWWWIERYIQMRKEFELRGMDDVPFPPDISLIGEPHPPLIAPNSSRIFRFGQGAHLEGTLSQGHIRVAPASEYKGTGLNAAQSDNELRKPHFSHGSKVKAQTEDGKPFEIKGFLEYSKSGGDYYTVCASREYDRRLQRAFGVGAALAIWDVDEFSARLAAAVAKTLPGWTYFDLPTEYYDPYRLEPKQHVTNQFSKNFSYAYQREYRFMWRSKQPLDKPLEAFFVDAGDLTDIATLLDAYGNVVGGLPLPAVTKPG
jgi:hypothetical protein